ncbi:hypothetical protein BJX61DRAFT_495166 [Aspergillus egyptiacus]|nr:hypothetical protein BJX61DRAFT_495166 [Aspergillus egyptiacus]
MPSQENTGNSYFGANTLRQLSWVLAAVILGLSAPIVARPSNSNNALMKGAAAYNLALVRLHYYPYPNYLKYLGTYLALLCFRMGKRKRKKVIKRDK